MNLTLLLQGVFLSFSFLFIYETGSHIAWAGFQAHSVAEDEPQNDRIIDKCHHAWLPRQTLIMGHIFPFLSLKYHRFSDSPLIYWFYAL